MLYDLQTKEGYVLSDSPTIYLRYFNWSPDSASFYLISRPVSETAKPLPQTPFGLLALDPLTRQFTQLFDQAMDAQWSPDKQKWFVVFPAKQTDGTRGLVGGIFDPQAGTLMGREFISDHLLYANPGEGDLVPAAWSNDSTRVVFGDSQGNLTLLNVDGTTQPLASGLPTEGWPKDVHYSWSPDDQHLLVQYGEQAWIATIP